jgi:hypothetical protein
LGPKSHKIYIFSQTGRVNQSSRASNVLNNWNSGILNYEGVRKRKMSFMDFSLPPWPKSKLEVRVIDMTYQFPEKKTVSFLCWSFTLALKKKQILIILPLLTWQGKIFAKRGLIIDKRRKELKRKIEKGFREEQRTRDFGKNNMTSQVKNFSALISNLSRVREQ